MRKGVSTRTRLALTFTGMLLVCLLLTAALAWYELVHEPDADEVPEADREETIGWRLTEVVLRGSIPVALLAVGGWWLMRKVFIPIEVLTRAAEKVDATHFGEPLPLSGRGDEFDRLTDVFNGMRSRLQASFSHVREFTLHASHELKTPLTVLHATFERELHRPGLDDAQRDAIVSRLDEVQRMTKIVDALSLLTKADANMLELEYGRLRFDELVRDAAEDAAALGAAAKISVNLAECTPCEVTGDRHRLRQLLLVLVDNAVKYNHPGGRIDMALRAGSDGTAEFRITNTGPGLRAADQPRVFERFFRGDPSHNQRIEGSGLGLSIADWLVRAHRGRISLQSSPEATMLTVCLPLTAAPSSADETEPAVAAPDPVAA